MQRSGKRIVLMMVLLLTLGASIESTAALKSSAQPEVSLLNGQLDMPGLNRQRQLRIYLPPGYATSGKRYPVLYMHDAQNLFDVSTAYSAEWNVDETLNALAKSDQLEVIVVGLHRPAGRVAYPADPARRVKLEDQVLVRAPVDRRL